MKTSDYFKIGYVAKTHGLKGQVTVIANHNSPDWDKLKSVFIEIKSHFVPHFIHTLSITGEKLFVKFDDVDTLEKAAELKGASIYLSIHDRPKLKRGEFYDDEVIGFEVDDQNGVLGKVEEVVLSGANRLLSVVHQGKEVYIPVNGPFIQRIDKVRKKIKVELPEGFLTI